MNESTIFVYQRPEDGIRNVRCSEDGNLLCEAKGKVVYVVMGMGVPASIIKVTQDSYLLLKCKRCGTFYHILIQSI